MEPLTAAYERCRRLHRAHGRTYYLATRLLPAWKRRHVHALYGFTRYADDIVDGALPVPERRRRLGAWAEAFLAGQGTGDPLLPAVLHTVRVFDIDLGEFRRFFDSMAMDLTVRAYRTYDDLLGYMAGSAAAIGAMMLPVLGTTDGRPPSGRRASSGSRSSSRTSSATSARTWSATGCTCRPRTWPGSG